jgi:hypothetical protein
MPRTHSKSFPALQSAMTEVEEAREYSDRAEPEIIDEAIFRLKAAELRADRIVREIKKAPASVEAKQGARKKLLNFIIPHFRRLRK